MGEIQTDEEIQAQHDACRDDELEAVIIQIVARKNAAGEGSAERLMAVRQLDGLRNTRELAGPMIEGLDPIRWGK